MKTRNVILAIACLAASWYYGLSLASRGGIGLKLGFANDYFQVWNASKAILKHRDPYGPEITEQNQISTYGTTAAAVGDANIQVFPYPVQTAFPFLPLSLVAFRTADAIVLWALVILVALSVGWLRRTW